MKKVLFNLTRSVVWILASAIILLMLIFGYFQYPIDLEKKIQRLEAILPELEQTKIDWFVSDYCNMIVRDSKASVSLEYVEEGCAIKGFVGNSKVTFSDEDKSLFEKNREIINNEATMVGLRYDSSGNVVWARFTVYEKFGLKYRYYVFDPEYVLDSPTVDYPTYGNRIPINKDWYYIDIYN